MDKCKVCKVLAVSCKVWAVVYKVVAVFVGQVLIRLVLSSFTSLLQSFSFFFEVGKVEHVLRLAITLDLFCFTIGVSAFLVVIICLNHANGCSLLD